MTKTTYTETSYAIDLRDDGGGNETIYYDADNAEEAVADADDHADDWARCGEWGPGGARVEVQYDVSSYDVTDAEWVNIHSGGVSVDIEPDHEALISAAGGDTDCDHNWSSEGEGGCDENPGVWSLGGTTILTREHCTRCGLVRTETSLGSQRNPGESDTTTYTTVDAA